MYQTSASVNSRRLHRSEIGVDPGITGTTRRRDRLEQHTPAGIGTPRPLIRSKLSLPRACADTVSRSRLIEHLNAGLGGKATLLCAPAGFGKTTLLVEWLKTSSFHNAWLSLDENDNELLIFLHYLVAALQTVFPGACQAMAHFLKQSSLPTPDRAATLLINDLAELPEDLILVLDNYHTIHHSPIHALLDALIRYMPSQVHLVLATRSELPFPLARWRSQGQLNELHSTILRFTHDETLDFLTRILGADLCREVAEILEEETEGWIAMLRQAALSLHSASDRVACVEHLRNNPDCSMNTYLLEDFLARQIPLIQNFLVKVSILDQFCVSLCEATLDSDDTDPHLTRQAYLDCFERAKVFIVPLDEPQGWYRFHPLFKRFLEQRVQEQFTKEEIAALHLRASAWYAAHGQIDEAIRHALAAENPTEAAHVVETQFLSAMEQERWEQLEHWLQLLPAPCIKDSPGLLVARAWMLAMHGQVEPIPTLLTAAEHLLERRDNNPVHTNDAQCKALYALIALVWSHIEYATGQAQASLKSARSALKWITPDEIYLANLALDYQALSSQLSGHGDVAHLELDKALKALSSNLPGSARLLSAQAFLYLNAGKLQQMEQIARHLLRLSEEANLPISRYQARWLLGCAQYEWNRLDSAAHHFSAVAANWQHAHYWVVREAIYGLASVYQAQGLSSQARETTDALLESLQGQNDICALIRAYSFRGHLALLQDEMEPAEQWIEMVGELSIQGLMISIEEPTITKAQLLLARNDEHSVRQGQKLLSTLLCHLESLHNTRKTIQVLALQALAYHLENRMTEALEVLEHAIALAYPGRFIRTFADLPQLARLLQALRKRRKAGQASERQLDAYLQDLLVAISSASPPADAKQALLWQEGLEPLTGRELQILRLLGKDLTNKEIARELVISAGTVKVHTINVYRKLSVSNRRAAVALSRSLGLLLTDS
ncbi:MAG TPA: LuxR C-terminal-related transcriptional regulator [Ktedonobacteraceae bacterium]|nr:LuxR C-terminal-related transcriptional regulator [Ktedonobacteraceae bacterium]